MKKYRIWTSKNHYVDVVAECPSKAIEKVTKGVFWKIEFSPVE